MRGDQPWAGLFYALAGAGAALDPSAPALVLLVPALVSARPGAGGGG